MALVRKKEAGNVFAGIRIEMGFSQEKMAEVCDLSRSTIQKIESGEAVTEEKFAGIMGAIGITDIDYEELYINDTKEKVTLRQDILVRLALENPGAASACLEEYRALCGACRKDGRKNTRKSDLENNQFVGMVERLILLSDEEGTEFSAEEWTKLIRLTIPEFEIGKGVERKKLSKTEMMLFNICGLQLMWNGDYEKSRLMLAEIARKAVFGSVRGMNYMRAASAVAVNLAFCLIYMNETAVAGDIIRYAMKGYMANGGGFGWLQLMKAQLLLYERIGSRPKYNELLSALKGSYRCMSEVYRMKKCFDDFVTGRSGIVIL